MKSKEKRANPSLQATMRQGGEAQSAGANMAGELNKVMRNGGGGPPSRGGEKRPGLAGLMRQ